MSENSIKLTDLKPDPANANRGTERGLRMLDDSLSKVGLGRSIVVDKDMNVIAGNKTLETAIDRGFEDALIVHTKGDKLVVVVRDDMDLLDNDPNNPARQYAYYDNRVGQLDLEWNAEQLMADVQAGFNFDGLFEQYEMDEMFAEFSQSVEQDDADAEAVNYNSEFMILIDCDSESQQRDILERLMDEGLKCRALIS